MVNKLLKTSRGDLRSRTSSPASVSSTTTTTTCTTPDEQEQLQLHQSQHPIPQQPDKEQLIRRLQATRTANARVLDAASNDRSSQPQYTTSSLRMALHHEFDQAETSSSASPSVSSSVTTATTTTNNNTNTTYLTPSEPPHANVRQIAFVVDEVKNSNANLANQADHCD